MTIHLAADHAGFALKEKLKAFLISQEYQVEDHGALSYSDGDDYPDYMRPAAEALAKNPEEDRAIIIGGSGQGEAMVANRVKNVRCAVYYGVPAVASAEAGGDPYIIVKLSREHNNANALAIGARFVKEEEALAVVKLWLAAPFPGDERHTRRIGKF